MSEHAKTNRLSKETSPYLVQHAQNPVDWFPWGDEAFKKSRAENKPILLSIGYSACHWCHVMEHESFSNEEIAGLMNKYFVNVKVDREERPDVDNIYQTALQVMGQGGGWPLTMFLTPDLEPFYGGTYFPPENRYSRPGFPSVLLSIAKHFHEETETVAENAQQVKDALAQINSTGKVREEELTLEILERSLEKITSTYDPAHGGFGSEPKFPNTMLLSFLMRMSRLTENSELADMAVHTLKKMAEGGIFDHLAGGYARYSVDSRWLVPHFEKMLYDNALITLANVEAFQLSKEPLLKKAIRETLDFVLAEMTHDEGGFYSSFDADTEGEEGKCYVWTSKEIHELLGEKDGKIVCAYFGVTAGGNFENNTSVLHQANTPRNIAFDLDIDESEIMPAVETGRQKLLAARRLRPQPALDDKVITSWNGLMISAFAMAGLALDEPRYKEAAVKGAEFILKWLSRGSELRHTYRSGRGKLKGFLDDYAFFTAALLDVHQITQDHNYLEQAVAFTDEMVKLFTDDRYGGYFYTPRDGELLIQRPKTALDQSLPSGVAVGVSNLFRLFSLTERADFRLPAIHILRIYRKDMEENPAAFGSMLNALETYISGMREVVVVGDPEQAETRELVNKIYSAFQPNKVVFLIGPGQVLPPKTPDLLQEKTQLDGKPTVYVCRNFVCSSPVTEWEDLEPLLIQMIA
ncbi:MAG: thioredoxin domain-containing protein [Planctomycetota bacterium]|nr:thioredoxin domain-containing protein [Planctomycetota bacterium]MDA1141574.1 thioredoxin domain-containing protein [Planctomycetota bacterium]